MAWDAWDDLAPNQIPNTNAVADAIDTGVLIPSPLWDIPGPPPATQAWTRSMYQNYIRHEDMSGSGIDSNRLMTRAWMEEYAHVPVLTPQNFLAMHNMGACPVYRIDLSWDNGGRLEEKMLDWSPDGESWFRLSSSIPAASTGYTHQGGVNSPQEGINYYRIRFVSESQWAETTAVAFCPI